MKKVPRIKAAPEAPDLDAYDPRFLACRDFRHAWELGTGYYRSSGSVVRVLRCLRCKVEREDRWTGHEVSRRYQYPEGYRVEGRVLAVDVRDAVMRRATIYEDEQSLRIALAGGTSSDGNRADIVDIRVTEPERRATAKKRSRVTSR